VVRTRIDSPTTPTRAPSTTGTPTTSTPTNTPTTPTTQTTQTTQTNVTPTTAQTPVADVVDSGTSVSGSTVQQANLATVGATPQTVRRGAADVFSTTSGSVSTTSPIVETKIQKLYSDPAFVALYDFAMRAVDHARANSWDKLGQVHAFTTAMEFAAKGTALDGSGKVDGPSLKQRFTGPMEQRAIAHLLALLMPDEFRTERVMYRDGRRGPAQDVFSPLPAHVIARADVNFALKKGDLPTIAPVLTAHLTKPGFLDDVFKKGQQGTFLASKSFCPGAFLQDRKDINGARDKASQSGHVGDGIPVQIDDVIVKDGKKFAVCSIPEQKKWHIGDDGNCYAGEVEIPRTNRRIDLDSKGMPVQTEDPILIPVEHLATTMLDAGSGSRGLDFKSAEDRALALTFSEVLKETRMTDSSGTTKTLFDWMESASSSMSVHDRTRLVEGAAAAAFQSVMRFACHPGRTHFKLNVAPDEIAAVRAASKLPEGPARQEAVARFDWQARAYVELLDTRLVQDCGERYPSKFGDPLKHPHELPWTTTFLKQGFVGGSLDCVGLGDAFDKIATTFLAPMGFLTMDALAEGHGSMITRILQAPDENGVIQAGTPGKTKPTDHIFNLDWAIASGRGPTYPDAWPGHSEMRRIPTDGRGVRTHDLAALDKALQQATAALTA